MAAFEGTVAPRPWKIVREMDGEHWTDSCSIFDAEGGEVCVLTRGYEKGPSLKNAELIVYAVNTVHEQEQIS